MWFDSPEPDDPTPGDPLQPFHFDTRNGAYTSDMVRDWTKLNYTYDVLVPAPEPVEDEGILAKPAPSVAGQERLAIAVQPSSGRTLSHLRRTINNQYASTRKSLIDAPEIHGRKNDYIINIVYDRYVLSFLPF
jgi:tyrosinase